jgi:integrase
MSKSTRSQRVTKPYPSFPLTPNNSSNRWCKKINGVVRYFGPLDDPQGALARYEAVAADLRAGRTPKTLNVGYQLRELLNDYLTHKRALLDSKEITWRTWNDYHDTCTLLADGLGKHTLVKDLSADDFERLRAQLAQRFGPTRLGNLIQRIRSVFKFGIEAGKFDKPVVYGPAFKRPSKKVLRQQRAKRGPRMFEAEQLRLVLAKAVAIMRAMILLAANTGLGNHDIATIELGHLDFDSAWMNFPRPKTAIQRRGKLWSETVEALRLAIAGRPDAHDPEYAQRVFITKYGNPFANGKYGTALGHEFKKLLRAVGLDKDGLNFYALRHGFETIAGDTADQVAVDAVMGHAREDMASVYRERVNDARLEKIARHVHDWLFAPSTPPEAILPLRESVG